MKTVAIVQARMGSTRLPGKVLKEILSRPLLSYQIERMKKIKLIDEIVIATTPYGNEEIIELCKREHIPYYIGSETDVLQRYYEAAKQYEATHVVRMTSDCPLIDPTIVDQIIHMYMEHSYDYVSNTIERTFPRGMDAEIFSFELLEKAYLEATLPYEREHVTPFMYLNNFSMGQFTQVEDSNEIRLTVDTEEDFTLIKKIIEKLYPEQPHFSLQHIMALLQQHPEWLQLNAHIVQKKLGE